MRSIWKGSISFGLVNIPVAVYPATREQKIVFKQLRKSDHSPIRYQKVAEADLEALPSARWTPPSAAAPGSSAPTASRALEAAPALEPEPASEIVKGYEYEKGKFVAISEEEFQQVKIQSTHTIEITDFVEQAQIDLKYFYKPYFLEPQKQADRGYSLLLRALAETRKVGIAKVAIRSREYLAAVKPDGLFLILELMHFAQEVLEPDGLRPASPEVAPKELEMAKHLIDAMTTDWTPQKYENSYQIALKELVEQKIQNRPPTALPAALEKQTVGDIMAILQRSLQQTLGNKKKPEKPPRLTTRKPTVPRSKRISLQKN